MAYDKQWLEENKERLIHDLSKEERKPLIDGVVLPILPSDNPLYSRDAALTKASRALSLTVTGPHRDLALALSKESSPTAVVNPVSPGLFSKFSLFGGSGKHEPKVNKTEQTRKTPTKSGPG